ncbi:putative ATP synthase 24 kDa subunit mitochondrial [Zea mays]|uniref:Putative ATP synthase 24 kDa subunit mitochondrial n=1 Tax=Zea mays TaxID=4577 RepID=A0A1D6QU19_MAIZE|nr:putative ATP synthase 24 kDa subunit mitochondrial [Zea mays]
MALAARLVSRSRQLHSVQAAFANGGATQVRSFAKDAAPADRPPVSGDGKLLTLLFCVSYWLKNCFGHGIFFEVKKKFETALGVLKKEKITIDPDDPAAVSRYAQVMKTVREKADLLSDSQRIKYTIETFTKGIPDARTYLNTLQQLRIKYILPLLHVFSLKKVLNVTFLCSPSGLIDHIGIEPLMMEALEKIEKDIKKPLLRSDKKNMATLMAEFDKINAKLGIRKEDLPKIEKELELEIAKSELTELKKECVEAMETQLKREEFQDEEMPDVRKLDIRNFL